jgi:dextranase
LYGFAAAYENLLFAPELEPFDPAALPLDVRPASLPLEVLSGQRLSDHGPGVIYPIFRRAPDAEIVHLVNLIGVDDDQWRNTAPPPEPQTDLRIRYRLLPGSRATSTFVASPDLQGGRPIPLSFTTGENESGSFVEVTITRLDYWDMLVIRTVSP